jgi:hypothetical protein
VHSVGASSSKVLGGARRGALVGAVTVAALLLAPGVASAAPGAGHGAPKNHAPDAPSGLLVSDPYSPCVPSTAVPVRSTTPTLSATLTDPDGELVAARFEVRDGRTGKRVWGPALTGDQSSGAAHAVRVPAGLLQDGRVYEWRVQARDEQGRKSPTVGCRILVDVTAPVVPGVEAVVGTAPAVYLEDQTSGAPGAAGEFRFEAGASTDVVAFLWSSGGATERVDVPAGSTGATVTVVPTTAGPQELHVQAVDAAGNVGAERVYGFTVAPPALAGTARWLLDEGTGFSAADADPSGAHPLTVSTSTTWTDGLLAQLAHRATDRALLFDEAADGAATAGPVVDTAGSFSVIALVRADGSGAATAISQDGTAASAFTLGTRTDRCADGAASCWALTVAGTDPSNPDVVATSTVPVVQGDWVMLAGVRDAVAGTVRLDVCSFGSPEVPGRALIVSGAATAVAGTTPAVGPLRLGSAQGQATPWVGAVSVARTYGSAIGAAQERLVCSGGA